MPDVFISYRHDDTRAVAHRLRDGLDERLGRNHVFLDDSIEAGSWVDEIDDALDSARIVLALIGASWLTVKASPPP
jgi:hypothetical protein